MKMKNVVKIGAVLAGIGAVGYATYLGLKKLMENKEYGDYYVGDCDEECENECDCKCHEESACDCSGECNCDGHEKEDEIDKLVKDAVDAAAEVNGEAPAAETL